MSKPRAAPWRPSAFWTIPRYRAASAASLAAELAGAKGSVHVIIDNAGLKVYGSVEWRWQAYGGRDRRIWRKRRLAVNPDSGEILASDLG